MRLDVVVAGVGGQGVVTLASTLVQAASREGHGARFLAQSGITQLGSSVVAHVRIGTPPGPSPKIPGRSAHLVVGLERLEARRLVPYLASDGTALLSRGAVHPFEARHRPHTYPEPTDVEREFPEGRIRWVDADIIARRHGPPALVSAVMLGAVAGATTVVERENLVISLREARPALADAEVEAFFEGYRAITGRDE